MSWRVLEISNPCKLSVKNRQLSYIPIEGESVSLPLEDIAVIILDNKQISLNSSLLSELAEYGIALFSCDYSHIPSGIFLPFHAHSRYSEIAWMQAEWSEPFKKRIWQNIVKCKITNQGLLLKQHDIQEYKKLLAISKQVQSGDAKNSEAYAASVYWKALFNNFTRQSNDERNSALNYGYAILRGTIARAIVGAGFLPCFGIFHSNKLNSFNLADDLIEPFRPFVDNIVYHEFGKDNGCDANSLTKEMRQKLISVLTRQIEYNGEQITVLKACEKTASSLVNASKNKDYNLLSLPNYLDLPLFDVS